MLLLQVAGGNADQTIVRLIDPLQMSHNTKITSHPANDSETRALTELRFSSANISVRLSHSKRFPGLPLLNHENNLLFGAL